MPTRRCMVTDNDGDVRCLGHPSVDAEWWPAMCDSHIEAIFGRYLEVKAQALADQIVTERLQSRPRWNGHDRTPQSRRSADLRTAKLRPGQHLTDQDQATLAFLTGRAA